MNNTIHSGFNTDQLLLFFSRFRGSIRCLVFILNCFEEEVFFVEEMASQILK